MMTLVDLATGICLAAATVAVGLFAYGFVVAWREATRGRMADIRQGLGKLSGVGPLDEPSAKQVWGACLLVRRWANTLALAMALIWLMGFIDLFVAAVLSAGSLLGGWLAVSLGVRRMRRSMHRGGYGPTHIRP